VRSDRQHPFATMMNRWQWRYAFSSEPLREVVGFARIPDGHNFRPMLFDLLN
jgi:hypothetical protein